MAIYVLDFLSDLIKKKEALIKAREQEVREAEEQVEFKEEQLYEVQLELEGLKSVEKKYKDETGRINNATPTRRLTHRR